MKDIQLEIQKMNQGELLEEILDIYTLKKAFKRVKKNKGAPGIDGITVDEYGQNLEEELKQLKEETLSWSYKPTPVEVVGLS